MKKLALMFVSMVTSLVLVANLTSCGENDVTGTDANDSLVTKKISIDTSDTFKYVIYVKDSLLATTNYETSQNMTWVSLSDTSKKVKYSEIEKRQIYYNDILKFKISLCPNRDADSVLKEMWINTDFGRDNKIIKCSNIKGNYDFDIIVTRFFLTAPLEIRSREKYPRMKILKYSKFE